MDKKISRLPQRTFSIFMNPHWESHKGYENGFSVKDIGEKLTKSKKLSHYDLEKVSVGIHQSIMNPKSKWYLPIISKRGIFGWRYFFASAQKDLVQYKEARFFLLDSSKKITVERVGDGVKMLAGNYRVELPSPTKVKEGVDDD